MCEREGGKRQTYKQNPRSNAENENEKSKTILRYYPSGDNTAYLHLCFNCVLFISWFLANNHLNGSQSEMNQTGRSLREDRKTKTTSKT